MSDYGNSIRPTIFHSSRRIAAAVSSRKGGVSPEPFGMNLSFNVGDDPENVTRNRELFFTSIGVNPGKVAFTRQVHGDTIRIVDTPGLNESTDALITAASGLFLTVSIADCNPILLFDPVTNVVAAVHAGWRGSRLAILSKTIKILEQTFHVIPADLLSYIGPSAGVCCYEVGEEVAQEFDERFLQRQPGRKHHLDLKLFNQELLKEAGVPEQQIEVSPYCTICHPELFHSYRREGTQSGRMLGGIGLLPVSDHDHRT